MVFFDSVEDFSKYSQKFHDLQHHPSVHIKSLPGAFISIFSLISMSRISLSLISLSLASLSRLSLSSSSSSLQENSTKLNIL